MKIKNQYTLRNDKAISSKVLDKEMYNLPTHRNLLNMDQNEVVPLRSNTTTNFKPLEPMGYQDWKQVNMLRIQQEQLPEPEDKYNPLKNGGEQIYNNNKSSTEPCAISMTFRYLSTQKKV